MPLRFRRFARNRDWGFKLTVRRMSVRRLEIHIETIDIAGFFNNSEKSAQARPGQLGIQFRTRVSAVALHPGDGRKPLGELPDQWNDTVVVLNR